MAVARHDAFARTTGGGIDLWMMRDSCIRARRTHDGLLVMLASLSTLAPVTLALAWLSGRGDIAWRTLVVQASLLAGVPQGAALVAAVLKLSGTHRAAQVRRAAEAVALGLPVAFAAQVVLAIAASWLCSTGRQSPYFQHLFVAVLLDGVGAAFVAASLSTEVSAAIDRGEVEGRLAQWLATLWPRSRHRASTLAFAYLVVFIFGAPYLAHATLGPLGSANTPWLRAPYLALDDIVVALAASLLAARIARDGDARVTPLSHREARDGVLALTACAAVLGLVLLAQLCAPLHLSPLPDGGLLPTMISWRGWYALALFGLAFAHFAPAAAIVAPGPYPADALLTAASAVLLVGSWVERAAIAQPSVAPGYGIADLFTSIGAASGGAFIIVATFGIVAMDSETSLPGRQSHTSIAR